MHVNVPPSKRFYYYHYTKYVVRYKLGNLINDQIVLE